MNDLGKTFIIIGMIVTAIGALLLLAGRIPWVGRLPGDIFVKRGNLSFYFPLTTCIIVSIFFSLLLWLFRK